MKHIFALSVAMLPILGFAEGQGAHTIDIRADRMGAEIQPTMYGLFFEDINYGADGGLYAEMVKNRSFEFPQSLMGWQSFGKVEVKDQGGPFDRNPHYVSLSGAGHRSKYTGLENEGFFGYALKAGEEYRLTFYARLAAGELGKLRFELVDPASGGETVVLAKADIKVKSGEWTRYEALLKPEHSVERGRLRVFLRKPDECTVDLEHVSLFPVDTWKGRPGGLRRDLAQALADINPSVFRFPGGCIVEGTEIPDRYRWKTTVGPVENRPLNINRWQFEFPHRFYPDYYQSGGLGFYEYFLLSEDMGAAPLPVLNVGMVCQYQNPDPSSHVAADSLDEYIQDAIDLVEFANGDTMTVWGGLRADMGHPAPFGLKYLAIGNEQWGPEYVERLEPFVKALRKACPDITIIGSSGPSPDGDKFDYLWPEMRRLDVDLVDEHYYCNEEWFRNSATRYDNYPRRGPKVFAGEYACHGKGRKYNHYNAALLEAAFMTGLERNADVVQMATYAPLLAHKEGWQWRPDMIWFDNMGHRLTSSYHVQQLYSHNRGTRVVPLTDAADGKPMAGQDGIYATAAYDEPSGDYIVKLVNTADAGREVTLNFTMRRKTDRLTGLTRTLMLSKDISDVDNDECTVTETVVPGEALDAAITVKDSKANFNETLPPYSFTVLRFSARKGPEKFRPRK